MALSYEDIRAIFKEQEEDEQAHERLKAEAQRLQAERLNLERERLKHRQTMDSERLKLAQKREERARERAERAERKTAGNGIVYFLTVAVSFIGLLITIVAAIYTAHI